MADFDPTRVNLTDPDLDPAQVICALSLGGNDYNGQLGARVSAIFVILVVSTAVTFFPVLASRMPSLRIPLGVYLFARYFGAGVIVATAFIHLLDPAYAEIGGSSCVGMTGGWGDYAWCPAIVLTAVVVIFLTDLAAERYVEVKYGVQAEQDVQAVVTNAGSYPHSQQAHVHPETADDMAIGHGSNNGNEKKFDVTNGTRHLELQEAYEKMAFRQQFAAFLILEFGVIFHSVVIGLNLGVVGDEFSTLYPVLVFHQSFEGLGIGARMSAIPFPNKSWLPWLLCLAYGLTTPISIAIGLGVRTTYEPESYTANVVSGVLDSISAGILLWTGLVELLARDFIFDPKRTKNNRRLILMVVYTLLGAGLMALLGKWA